jgi:thioredoxin-related protein
MLPAAERANYLAEHYWDKFDFRDTTFCNKPDITEQAYANYLDMLRYVDLASAQQSVSALMKSAEVDTTMFGYFVSLADKYLYDPNSPFRNDELLIPALEAMIASPLLDEAEKIRPQSQLDMAQKNRIGQKANDFRYTLHDGRSGRMYSIEADYLLIFINNPDCPACKEIREQICASPMLSEMIERGVMKVLAIYPDEDITAWLNYRHNIPASWINSYDKQLRMRDEEIYDLKAIPSLYLLDAEKRVMLKDCNLVPQIEEAIFYAEQSK